MSDKIVPFPGADDPADDPDGFDAARRREVLLRMLAMTAGHERERRIATMTPLEIAQSDLAAMIEMARQFEAGETTFPLTPSNRRAMTGLLDELRARVEALGG
jgi:hypothetical protein